MSDQDNGQVSTLQRPTTDDPKAWKAYWDAQGMQWRAEPEIDAERQKYLTERRAIIPDIKKGIYPFRDIKLSRADVEWLLATHENRRGPVDWEAETQRRREGLDMRGADIRRVNLQSLPLSRMRGGLTPQEWDKVTAEQREMAAIHLEGAYLWDAQLSEASLRGAHFEGANLHWIHLEGAALLGAHFEGTNLRWGRLQGAFLQSAHLEGADLHGTRLEGANLKYAYLGGKLTPLNILEYMKHNDVPSTLSPTNLQLAFFDSGTNLSDAIFGNKEYGFVTLADAHWSDANLAVVKWSQVDMLGDEYLARQNKQNGRMKDQATRLKEYEIAIRANRQLAVALQTQGLNEEAARFAYRAQLCQRVVLRRQKKFGQYFFSLLLDLLAGYGYRPGRSVIWYLATIFVFAFAYHFLGGLSLYPLDAFVFSIMSFHGRGFFPALSQETNLHNPLVMLAALEAIIGLLIEISFIATFTQRFFGR